MQQLTQNYFQLFGLPDSFELDLLPLAEKYREMQSEVHPDRFVNAQEPEKMRAVQLSSILNEAYGILKEPLKRAGYLLTLQDLDIERAAQGELGMDLLMEQMQLRESLDEMPKDESALPELAKLKADVTAKLSARVSSFGDEFAQGEFMSAKKTFHEMQFLHKLLSEIDIGEEHRLGY